METRPETESIRSYRDLVAWQKAMLLAQEVYRATASFPHEEIYGLTSQMLRAAVSIASNIAEGHDRHSRGEYIQFIGHARGSLSELETQALLAGRLDYLSTEVEHSLAGRMTDVGRLLNGLRRSLLSAAVPKSQSRNPR